MGTSNIYHFGAGSSELLQRCAPISRMDGRSDAHQTESLKRYHPQTLSSSRCHDAYTMAYTWSRPRPRRS